MNYDDERDGEIFGSSRLSDEQQNANVNQPQKEESTTDSGRSSRKEPARLACETGNDSMYKTGMFVGNTAAGLGLGLVAGIGTVVAAAAVEVAVPVILVLKVFGLTGGAVGFLKGMKHTKN